MQGTLLNEGIAMNVMKVLKEEIVRLARKEIKGALASVKKTGAGQRRAVADLRRLMAALQKDLASLKKALPARENALLAKAEPEGRFWITGKGVKNLRKRLGATQAELAKLVGVSAQSVVKWEAHKGKINLRKAAAGKLQKIRGLGKKEVASLIGKKLQRKAKRS